MLRIRKEDGVAKIKITIEKECPEPAVEHTLADIKGEINDGLATLLVVCDTFDEVRIDNDGALHCRNQPPEEGDKPEKDAAPEK